MKAFLVLSAIVSMAAVTAHAQNYQVTQNVTFALTKTYAVPSLQAKDDKGLPARDSSGKTYLTSSNSYSAQKGAILTSVEETGSRLLSAKYSNKEILLDLVADEVIPTIVGYSFMNIETVNHTTGEGTSGLYLVKRGTTPILLDGFAFETEGEEEVETNNYKKITVTDTTKFTEKVTEAGSLIGREEITVTLLGDLTAKGVNNYTASLRPFRSGATQFYAWVPGAGRMTGFIGKDYGSANQLIPLVEGSITYTAGILSNISGN